MSLPRRSLCLAAALVCASAAFAAPLPVLWPLDLAEGKIGWRFDRDFISWPGEYWRGPGGPPCAADPAAPTTWGVLHLGGRFDPPQEPQYGAADVVAPLTEENPVVNGVIGYDEWSHALPVIMPYGCEGEELFLLLQRTDYTLYVCIAAPSLPTARAGQLAELYFDRGPTECGQVASQHLLLQATLDDTEHTTLRTFVGNQGNWTAQTCAPCTPALRAAGSPGGDGAWGYPAFEFAIPLSQLGTAGCAPDKLGLMARLQTCGHGAKLAAPEIPPVEALYWPEGRTGYGIHNRPTLGDRPDAWGHLQLSPCDPQAGFVVPQAAAPIRVDGQIGLKEWQCAAVDRYRFPGDQYRVLRAVRDETNVYLSVRTRTARGGKCGESLGIYLDPCADGGLRPHSDDVLYRVPLGVENAAEVYRYSCDHWVSSGKADLKAASYPLNQYESSYEIALPLSLFQKTNDQTQAPNLAVEVAYERPATTAAR